ncbi:transcription-repair coupling factor [Marinoscillum pacificum]|uniref:transcription-repair coupling factor n=1 Tax=Marinoscillum pacificum TaxID=392723 RepID=UPI00358E08A5
MEAKEILKHFAKSDMIQTISGSIMKNSTVRLKGMAGSFDAVFSAVHASIQKKTNIFILHDKEEANYFLNDLRNFLPEEQLLLFPSSYKKPYQFEATENANILQRAEVLNQIISQPDEPHQVITYPDALYEKVINKRSLQDNTFVATVGEKLDIEFLTELLTSYDFERTDFVYEAGQFAVRGGIIDIYSFAHDYPYRLELFGDEIESIREFDPESQLSSKSLKVVTLIPNVQTRLLKEERQSFFEFIPKDTVIWMKDYRETLDLIEKGFLKAVDSFDQIMRVSGYTQVVFKPIDLFDSEKSFDELLKRFHKVEFGNRFYLKPDDEYNLGIRPQPHFHKNFNLLAEDLFQYQVKNFEKIITAESFKQLERLESIFKEINPELQFSGVDASLREGFIDDHHELVCYTDHQIFDRFHQYKAKEKFSKSKSLTLRELKTMQPGDYVVHIDYGVGRFAGLDTVDVNGNKQEALRLIYRDDDLLYVSIHSLHKVSKYSSKDSEPPSISKLGTQDWENKKKKVKKKVKDIAKDLINLYAKRKAAPGFAYPDDSYLQAELESSFLYQDTPDQALATEDVKKDMQQGHPMDRLVCGDVGFGKTEIAVRAAFKAVDGGKQVAVLVPTTILAMQHYRTFASRLADFPVGIDYINRFKTTKEINDVKKKVKDGKIDILIGTHRIVNKDIEFKDLGLMIIDEEQKFGVKVKDQLKEMRVNVDALTLTATPIPRTLHFSLMGARDLSIISTPPPNRRPVTTEIHDFNEEIIRDAVSHELRRGGQVFVVHNRVGDIEQIGNIILRLVPDAKIGIAHGQMDGKQLEKVMLKFIEGEYDVLVSTNIIESGLDIPNANTIIINRAHMFGLSDLHQMRGRVGRSNTKAYCYLLTPPSSALSADSRKRLTTLEEFSDLGDGFKVAMRDLDIRGAGNLLGAEQSGFVNDMGFEVYHKILDEAVAELKETEFKELFQDEMDHQKFHAIKEECVIETDLEILIPQDYVSNISERLNLYSKMDSLKTEAELEKFIAGMQDRFGPLPDAAEDLMASVRLRWAAIKLGFEKVSIKNEVMRCYLSDSRDEKYFQSDIFGGILQYVQSMPRRCAMKDQKKKLIISVKEISGIDEALDVLNQMDSTVSV